MALGIMHPSKLQKDLMMCGNFQNSNGQARRLQDVAYRYLGQNIQAGKHSARLVMTSVSEVQAGTHTTSFWMTMQYVTPALRNAVHPVHAVEAKSWVWLA